MARALSETMLLDGALRPVVVGAVGDHELHLVERAEQRDVLPAVPVRLSAAWCLEVDDAMDARVDPADVALAARLEEHGTAGVAELAQEEEASRAAGAARLRSARPEACLARARARARPSAAIRSPPWNACGVSHQAQRRLQPVRRTNVHGIPAKDDSPWIEA